MKLPFAAQNARFFKKLKRRFPRKQICLIWDNAKWHKGALIRKELSSKNTLSNFHLINLPPYAPDKNPKERIWKDAKDEISNKSFDSFVLTKKAFKRAVLGRAYHYKLFCTGMSGAISVFVNVTNVTPHWGFSGM